MIKNTKAKHALGHKISIIGLNIFEDTSIKYQSVDFKTFTLGTFGRTSVVSKM